MGLGNYKMVNDNSIYYKEEHILLRKMVREFAQNELAPLALEIDSKSKFPSESIKKLSKLGLMGIPWDPKYGGGGMDTLSLVITIEELAKVCVSTAVTLMAHTSLGTGPFDYFGTTEQKEKYLTKLASGEIIGSFALTEPNAGSDAGNTQTKAVLEGDEYIVNGQKVFCTNVGYAGCLIFTSKIIENGVDLGIGALYINPNTKGINLGQPENKMGWKGSDTRSIYFDQLHVPKKNILGTPGQGFKQFLKTLTIGRISISALGLGISVGAYELALKYSNERSAFGKKINNFQAISFKLADMYTQISASRQLIYHAAWLKDQGKDMIKDAAVAKLFSSESAMKITTDAIQIHGGYGYIEDYHVERFFRDAKILEIGEGTSEVQRIVIAREILKKYSSS
jgi:alkylation response protein AidB-like acyl-CoA dehydrogenase